MQNAVIYNEMENGFVHLFKVFYVVNQICILWIHRMQQVERFCWGESGLDKIGLWIRFRR